MKKASRLFLVVFFVSFTSLGVISCETSKNPLLNVKLKEAVIKNNANQDIGTRGYINLPNKIG